MISTSLVDTISAKEIMENSVNRAAPKTTTNDTVAENATSISVIYTGDLDAMMLDETSTIYKAVNAYHLNLQDPFEIDENMKGIVLTSYGKMENPVRIAKQISIGENILMVEVKNLPEADV